MRSCPDPLVLTLLCLYAASSSTVNANMVAVLDFPVTWNNSCRDSGPGGDGVCLPRSALGVPGSWAHAFAHRRWRSMRQWTFLGRTAHCSLGFDRALGRPIKPTLLSSDRVTPHTFTPTVPLRERTAVFHDGAHTFADRDSVAIHRL